MTVLAAVNTLQNHPSVANIKHRGFKSILSFINTNENEVRKIIKNLNARKTCQSSDIPVHAKKFKCDKANYRPVLNISNIDEKIIYDQLYEYFCYKLFSSQC